MLFLKNKKQHASSQNFPRMFWLFGVSWSYFKRKRLSVSPVVAQTNHMSGSHGCSSRCLVVSDAASRQAQAWTLLSTA